MSQQVHLDRLGITCSKPFDAVVASLRSTLGQPDVTDLFARARVAKSYSDVEHIVQGALGRSGLMLFAEYDLGLFLNPKDGSDSPKSVRFLVGNPLIMKEMVKRVPDAGSYAPVTILIDERPDGVHISYERMESYLLPYGDSDALAVARNLDSRIATLLRGCAS